MTFREDLWTAILIGIPLTGLVYWESNRFVPNSFHPQLIVWMLLTMLLVTVHPIAVFVVGKAFFRPVYKKLYKQSRNSH